jgi:hypothetical protein
VKKAEPDKWIRDWMLNCPLGHHIQREEVAFLYSGETYNNALHAFTATLHAAHEKAIVIPEGHIMLPGRRVVKVLGTLPMTADGCVVGFLENTCLYEPDDDHPNDPTEVDSLNDAADARTCYSTRQAARAAKSPTTTGDSK